MSRQLVGVEAPPQRRPRMHQDGGTGGSALRLGGTQGQVDRAPAQRGQLGRRRADDPARLHARAGAAGGVAERRAEPPAGARTAARARERGPATKDVSPPPRRRRRRHGAGLRPAATTHATVRQGSKGDEVKAAQNKLNHSGASPMLVVDGAFGPLTKAAAVKFQGDKKL